MDEKPRPLTPEEMAKWQEGLRVGTAKRALSMILKSVRRMFPDFTDEELRVSVDRDIERDIAAQRKP